MSPHALRPLPCLLLLAVAGCSHHTHTVRGEVTLRVDAYRAEGYDEDDPRLLRSQQEIEELLGRPVPLLFNVDQMPREETFFEHLFQYEIGKIPKEMASWKHSYPDQFDRFMAPLQRIDFDYDGATPATTAEFDPEAGRMRFVLDSWRLDDRAIQSAMYAAHVGWLRDRYRDIAPAEVADDERTRYFEYLTTHGDDDLAPPPAERDGKDAPPREPTPGRSMVIARMVTLARVVDGSDPDLAAKIEKRLLSDGDYLRRCYENHRAFVTHQRGVQDAPFVHAEQAWMGWGLPALERLAPKPRLALLKTLVPFDRDSKSLVAGAFPGFDYFEFGLKLMRAWAKAGYPSSEMDAHGDDPAVELFDFVLCPRQADERGRLQRRSSACRWYFYSHAVGDPKRRQRLYRAAIESEDGRLQTLVLRNLIHLSSARWQSPSDSAVGDVLDFWKACGTSPDAWKRAARRLAIEIDESTDLRIALYDETARLWKAQSKQRGVLLFLLARIDGNGNTMVNWEQFAKVYGAPISRGAFDTMLAQGALAFEEAHNVWPGLSRGWSPADAILKRLPAYLKLPPANKDLTNALQPIASMAAAMAGADDRAGVKKLLAHFEAFAARDPSKERQSRRLLERLRYRAGD